VLKQLDLTHVQHTRVGDELTRGLSGGEKKRVSIGIELVANPSAIFLDEPTSGLDASSAESLTRILEDVAKTGRCVVAVIHQPRYESFKRFDNLLLMGHKGHCAYFGPTKDAAKYFTSQDPGLRCPAFTNVANYLLDVVSGIYDADRHRKSRLNMSLTRKNSAAASKGERDKIEHAPAEDAKSSRQKKRKLLAEEMPAAWKRYFNASGGLITKGDVKANGKIIEAKQTSIPRTAFAMAMRSFILFIRDVSGLRLFLFLSVFMSLTLSSGFSPYIQNGYTYTPPLPLSLDPWCPAFLDCSLVRDGIYQLMFFNNVALGATTMMVGARLFSSDILVVMREGRAGVSTLLQVHLQKTPDNSRKTLENSGNLQNL
ncbi:hypothetical protein AAMO2058_000344100, partial [Amorphochlora amoebiformis]